MIMSLITNISQHEANAIIATYKPIGLFYFYSRGKFIGIDNSTSDAWTEEFDTYEACTEWLNGGDL